MSLVVVGTNSWATVAEADTYFETRLFANKFWSSFTDISDKEAALVTAFNQLMTCGIFNLAASDTSANVKKAQFEMALFLLQHLADMDARKGLQAQGVVSAGMVGETYDLSRTGQPIPANVMAILKDSRTDLGIYGADVTRDDLEDV